jgi:F0F1-type ATP synthase assembly protein I
VIPGSGRLTRAAAASGSSAYQAVFEAVGSILLGCGIGFWVDRRFETAPVGVLVGAAIGFGAFVLRLLRLGKELHPVEETQPSGGQDPMGCDVADDLGVGEAPGLSQVLRDEDDGSEASDAADRMSDVGRETRD